MPLNPSEVTLSARSVAQRQAKPFTIVIFGASGDLTRRKIVPALWALYREGLIDRGCRIVGFARSDSDDASFRRALAEAIEPDAPDRKTWDEFAERLTYLRASYDGPEGYRELSERIAADAEAGKRRLYYLATPPESFVPIIRQLKAVCLTTQPEGGYSRVIIEKPFGRDLASAKELNAEALAAFDESQVYRIDHYLGKETVQNLLVFRFANTIFEPIWNQRYVDHVQITVAEALGIEGRGKYFESAGSIRDMLQNHMMHLLSLVAMEPPIRLNADAIRDEKVKVLRALRPVLPRCAVNSVVRGQYTGGQIDGERVPGYRDEPGTAEESTTETYVALRVFVDNWRWTGVPFYLRTGKRLPRRCTEISIHFKPVGLALYGQPPTGQIAAPNVLTIRVQPNEGISMTFKAKQPGPAIRVRPVTMDFDYAETFDRKPPEAYQRLLLDAALGDPTLFTRRDEVEVAWAFIEPILTGCAQQPAKCLEFYPAGSWGPDRAERLTSIHGNRWHLRA